ncbi:carboxypeptidase-like regulatory domain-containing protein [Membranicola marinus]|uniref:Carboxypeptidase-like regulatory domain-containing protein n=1 Tax=Membranihabitans marinus TaxID=1227546 RepID=A0A953I0F7_9BACT|nr:carboxypeptidase-like regulatory domain-containing protein [Membranihabitans marinus]MBY5960106.1 carboxypeptidase-like regulatory domain-containing protein [Membranihabitans marinus]
MKKQTLLGIFLLACIILNYGCDTPKPIEPSAIQITGIVIEVSTDAPIPDVQVRTGLKSTVTGSDGRFTIEAIKNDTVTFSKAGYLDTSLIVNKGQSISIRLHRKGQSIETVVLTGLTSGDMTLTSDKVYELDKKFVVANGHTVTIEPGTIIKGREGVGSLASAFIVAQGGKIMAEGTAEQPIIFTSVLDNITPGQKWGDNLTAIDREKWGGLIILGKAPISAGDGDIEAQIEGIPADEEFGKYGGDVPDDNSGVYKYISVRHGGALIGDGNEINGITLGGVGSGTVFEDIEVSATLDDGVEFFGGTVNAKNIIVSYQGDDAIDLDQNYSGTIENVLVIHGGDDSDKALEIDGPEGSLSDGLFTIDKGTFIFTGGSGTGADLKSKGQGTIKNSLFIGYEDRATILIRDDFDADNNCADREDSFDYLVADEPRLIFENIEILSSSPLDILVHLYTSTCQESITPEMEKLMLDVITNTNTKVVTEPSGNVGANVSVFGWTWSAFQKFYQ